MSCNKAMLRDPERRSDRWCGNCPKCRSVFLTLAPYLSPRHLTEIFGADLLSDAAQLQGFSDLIDINAKPYECVGEIESARLALAVLRTSDEWRNHLVVTSLGETAPVTHSSSVKNPPHFIPHHIYEHVAKVFSS
jgi:hypothetical protein